MGQVTIYFRGACTHFRNVVPGVPHRVVLVNAAAVQFGVLLPREGVTEWLEEPAQYVVFPHAAFLDGSDACGNRFRAPGAIEEGWIYSGSHLQIANAVDQGLEYSGFDENIPHLTDFVDRMQISTDVVMGGRAACYFDVFAGRVEYEKHGDSLHALMQIETNGNPVLRVTPFSGGRATDIPLEEFSGIVLANTDLELPKGGPEFDFLLHFLTASDGIPKVMKRAPYGYGMVAGKSRPDAEEYAKHLQKLIERGWPPWPAEGGGVQPSGIHGGMDTGASCSDSQYP